MFSTCCKLVTVLPNADSDRLRVILVAPRNPLNIGAATRAMSNFGFFHLRVVNPYELAFREARSAIGAEPLLAQATEFKTVAEAVADCTLVVGTTSVGQRQFSTLPAVSIKQPVFLASSLPAAVLLCFLVLRSVVFRTKTSATAIGSCGFPRAKSIVR